MLLCCDMLCVCVCVCVFVCECVCVTVSVIVCVNHMPKLPMSQKNKSHTTVKLGFFNLCTTPWAAAHFF